MGETFDPQQPNQEDPFGKYFEGIRWELPTDLAVVSRADDEIEKRLGDLRDDAGNPYWDEDQIINVAVGLREALVNAIVHGNMEITETDHQQRLEEIRRRKQEYKDKKIIVSVALSADTIKMVVTDEGQGFDVKSLGDPTDAEHIMNTTGRGALVMRAFFDSVTYNKKGNEVTLLIDDEGVIGKDDTDWPQQLPKRLKPEDVELFKDTDGLWHWHLLPEKIKDPVRREAYIQTRAERP